MGMALSAAVRTEVQGQWDRTYGCVVALVLRRDNKKWPPTGDCQFFWLFLLGILLDRLVFFAHVASILLASLCLQIDCVKRNY
jgi:hypothetical protein